MPVQPFQNNARGGANLQGYLHGGLAQPLVLVAQPRRITQRVVPLWAWRPWLYPKLCKPSRSGPWTDPEFGRNLARREARISV